MSLADTLKEAIRKTGLSGYRVALDAGVPEPVVSRFLRGERGINLDTAGKLADYLGLELRPIKQTRKAKGK